MKSMIPLSALTFLAALALVGCNQNSPGSSSNPQSTNSPMNSTNSTTGVITNAPPTNSLPVVATNMAAGTKQ
jgi:uncharacterized protein YcfL